MAVRDAPAATARYRDLDRLKTIAIAFVVLGHVVAREPPVGAEWFWPVKDLLYQFHMPLFMFVSGFLFFKTDYLRPTSRYHEMVRARVTRLMVPFLALGVVVVLLKYALGQVVHVDNPVDELLPALANIFQVTDDSPVTFIWYLFVLFLYSIVSPPLLRLARGFPGLFVVALALALLGDRMTMFFLEYGFKLFPFFVLGGTARAHQAAYHGMLRKGRLWLALPFILAVLAYEILLNDAFNAKYKVAGLLTVGLTAIPFFNALLLLPPLNRSRPLLALAPYVFAIYLFNVLFIGGTKAVLLKVMPWTAANFPLYLVILFGAGFLGPVLLKKYVIVRIRPLDRMTS